MTTRLLAPFALTLLGAVISHSQTAGSNFQATGVTRHGLLAFDAPVAVVFALFTPQGERHWAEGWDPQILFPRDREVAEGMVFQTRDHGNLLLTWTVTRYDEPNHLVAYNVVAPDLLVRRIEVRCRPSGSTRTEVAVTDSYVALSEQGNAFIDHLTEPEYANKMANWKERIGGYLAGIAKSDH